MNGRKRRQLNAMKRAKQCVADHPLNPPNAAVIAAHAALVAAINRIEALDGMRLHGTSTSRGAAEERHLHRQRLRSALSDLSRVSKTLDPLEYPDVAAQLKMGRLNRNAELLAYAHNAITVITPIKAVFIAHGAATTVIEDLQVLIDTFEASGDRRNRGLGDQIRCNVDMEHAVRDGMRQIRVLDAILSLVLKANVGLLAEWKASMRIERRLPALASAENPNPHESVSPQEGRDDEQGAPGASRAEQATHDPRHSVESAHPPQSPRSPVTPPSERPKIVRQIHQRPGVIG